MSPELLHILQHSLGVDKYGQHPRGHTPRDEGDGCGPYYRNHFCTGSFTPDGQKCEQLISLGYMKDSPGAEWAGEDTLYRVTPEGMAAMREHSPKPPKVSKAKRRYRAWLRSESSLKFFDWLMWRALPECIEKYGRVDA